MQVTTVPGSRPEYGAAGFPAETALSARAVVLRHLRTPAEIASILFLRDEIDLSVHTAAGRRQFEELEKKEMSAASSAGFSLAESGSARSGSSPWVGS